MAETSRILEVIVSTIDASGAPNFAPMGVTLDDDRVLLRPFRNARTWSNLREVGEGVVNITDEALLFARCALDDEIPPHGPAREVRGVVLDDVCAWKEFVIQSSDLSGERGRFEGRVVFAVFNDIYNDPKIAEAKAWLLFSLYVGEIIIAAPLKEQNREELLWSCLNSLFENADAET